MALSEQDAMQLLNFDAPLNLPALETAVMGMHTAQSQAQAALFNSILTQFKEHPQAWTRCHMILEQAVQDHTKYGGVLRPYFPGRS